MSVHSMAGTVFHFHCDPRLLEKRKKNIPQKKLLTITRHTTVYYMALKRTFVV